VGGRGAGRVERMHIHEHELIVKATAKVTQEIVEGRERKP